MTEGKFYAIVEFEDGLQVIPNNWLDINVMKAVWPHFTNYKRCDKAVKSSEMPESTWIKHPIRKIYGIYSNYAVAKQKLKEVEELSELNSGTEKEKYLNKTAKIKSADIIDTLTSSDEERNENFISYVKVLDRPMKRHCPMSAPIAKKSKDAQKDFNCVHNAEYTNTIKTTTLYDCYMKKEKENESISQRSLSFINMEDVHSMNNDDDSNKDPLSSSNLNEKGPQFSKNLSNCKIIEENEDNSSELSVVPDFEQKSDNFIVQKLINIERKLDRLKDNMNTFQKVVFQKLAIWNSEVENKENTDVFDNLPLKNENDLKIMEIKLKDDLKYRNQMIKQLMRITCESVRISSIRLIRAILANELAIKYSWYGAKKKQVFSKLEICKVIISVMRNLYPNVTDEEFAAPIKVWLAHAKERIDRENQKEDNH